MRHAVILAGGSGTRLWPASRKSFPKQFLPLADHGETLIGDAVDRARAVADHVVVVTSAELADQTRGAVPGVELVVEPAPRNTAAAIGLAAATIAPADPAAVIAVLPSDHHVRDREGMRRAIDECLTAADRDDVIALVGITPTRPETGFGYLQMIPGDGVRPVLRFAEKPDAEHAAAYLRAGDYLWNAGIFCLTARRALEELDRHAPEITAAAYESLPSISFDKAVIEKTDRIVAIEADVGWSDVGSWAAIHEMRGADQDNDVVAGMGVAIGGRGNVLWADDGTLIATVGVSDLVVVKSGGAILVCPKSEAQRVREVVETLGERGLGGWL